MKKPFVIGLDIGTTSAKAVLFDLNGIVIAEKESAYLTHHPQPGWSEQNPDDVEKAARKAIAQAVDASRGSKEAILAVGISSAMHSLICCDQLGKALSPSITWADGRSSHIAEKWKQNGNDFIFSRTGTPVHPMSPLLKLAWMKENNYAPYREAGRFFSIKEFLTWHWFGEAVVDYSVASSSGLFDIYDLDWNEEALKLAGISSGQLSDPVPPSYILQGLPKDIAEEMGLAAETPFVIGGSDGPLANLGIGAIQPVDTALTVGTSGAIRQMSSEPYTDDKQEVFTYAVDKDLWVMGGPTNNGAIVLQWLKELFGDALDEEALSSNVMELLTKEAANVPAGADNLLFLPYLNGERAPFWDANARGTYIGLSMTHKRPHMVRAGLEGVMFNLYHIYESVSRLTDGTPNIYASGGFSRSELWLQILADVFGEPIHIPESHQSSAWGAAWIALKAIGKVSSYKDIKAHVPMKKTIEPISENHKKYAELYQTFKELYPVLQPHFKSLR
ncbi:gluconokinase [Alteribacillus sp. JSM 102045]|uniref:gluconokinase n=1 Tax=Alteribacillus sp. JSM 102045 TaxID=1562101 RepID=UPI0035C2052A